MVECFQELSEADISIMSKEQAKQAWEDLAALRSHIRIQMDLLERRFDIGKKIISCNRCMSVEVIPMPHGGYLCKNCGLRMDET